MVTLCRIVESSVAETEYVQCEKEQVFRYIAEDVSFTMVEQNGPDHKRK